MTIKELNLKSNEELIAKIFGYGIIMSDESGTKKNEKALQNIFKVLQSRGIVNDWEAAYDMTRR